MAAGVLRLNDFRSDDYSNYLVSPGNQIEKARKGGRDNAETIFTYSNGTEWVVLRDNAKERFCGFLYLEDAIRETGLRHFRAAANKMTIESEHVIYLSKYCGEDKPSLFPYKVLSGTNYVCSKSRSSLKTRLRW